MWDRLRRTLGLFIGPDFVSVEGVPICRNPSHRPFFWSPPPGEGRRRVQWSMVGDHKLNDNSDLVSFAPPATVERGRRSVSDPKSIPPSLPDMIEHIVCPGKMYKELGFGLFYFSHWYLSVCSLLFVCLPIINICSGWAACLLVSPLSTPAPALGFFEVWDQ